jgi:pimeloyl-ACP methyl ester carboxylesterase
MSSHFVTSDDIRLSYTIDDFTDPWRPPATLLPLHAAMGSSKRWYAMVPPLCRHYRVVRLDLRGHGESLVPSADSPLSIDRLVQDVRELLDHIGTAGTVHIVGNSAGGYIAQQLAMQSPERVRSLVLFGSTLGLKESQALTWLPRVAREGLRNFLAATITDRFPAWHDPIGVKLRAVGDGTTPSPSWRAKARHDGEGPMPPPKRPDLTPMGHDPGNVEWFLDEAAKNDAAWIGRFVGLMASLWWMEDLPRIQGPTLLVAPDAEVIGYVGLPHNICDIVPDRCAADVLAFLRQRFPTG